MSQSGATATYQLIGDPAIKATADAAADLQSRATEWVKDRRQVQLPVLFISVPPNQALEDWVLRMFRALPRFRVYTHAEAAAALTPAELADFLAGRVTPAVKAGLLKGFGATKLLVVTIRPVDAAEGVYRYGTEGQLLDAASDSPPERFSTMGLSRDRRDRLAWIVLANVALLALALAAYALIVRTHRALAVDTSWLTLLVAPLAGFAVGRILPCVIAPLLGSLRLGPGTPLAAAFWFPLAGGSGSRGPPAGGLLDGVAPVGQAAADSQSGHPRRRDVRRDRGGHRRVPCRTAAAVLGRASADRRDADDRKRHALGVLGRAGLG